MEWRRRNKQNRFSDAQKKEMARLYEAGYTPSQIAEKADTSATHVSTMLKLMGVVAKRHRKGKSKTKSVDKKAAKNPRKRNGKKSKVQTVAEWVQQNPGKTCKEAEKALNMTIVSSCYSNAKKRAATMAPPKKRKRRKTGNGTTEKLVSIIDDETPYLEWVIEGALAGWADKFTKDVFSRRFQRIVDAHTPRN